MRDACWSVRPTSSAQTAKNYRAKTGKSVSKFCVSCVTGVNSVRGDNSKIVRGLSKPRCRSREICCATAGRDIHDICRASCVYTGQGCLVPIFCQS